MKQFILFYIILVIIVLSAYWTYNKVLEHNTKSNLFINEDGITYFAKTDGKDFLVHADNKWHNTFLKGVNLGVAKPGYFPGDFGITKEDYLRWFEYIYDMNSNVIRVYTLQSPVFYQALYEFNLKRDKPLYVIHGVWVNEKDIEANMDALKDDGYIEKIFISDSKEIVDAIHGNIIVKKEEGHASGNYNYDISQYVIAWILGIEFSGDFVLGTNENHPNLTSYDGKYLYTSEGASPFECFLTKVADEVIIYETDKYHMQRPTAISNWLTTDPLDHPNEPNPGMEDLVPLDVEHMLAKDNFEPGLFASYHIYPYYPDFLNYDTKYISKDKENINTYKAYLNELINHHTIPVLVSEFGVPSSRGIAHESKYSGFDQGHLSEKEQGNMIVSMIDDIIAEDYMGAIIFSWQDEWFKRSWNTVDIELADRRPFWQSPQTGEKNFGLLAFDSGKDKSICYVDGDVDEWIKDDIVVKNNDYTLSVKSDETYLYMYIDTKDYVFNNDTLIIPIDTINNQGNSKYNNLNLEQESDFVLVINGKNNTNLYVDSYYDWFYYTYAISLQEPLLARNEAFHEKNSGNWNPIYMALDKGWYLPDTDTTVPFTKFNTGKLQYGVANPESSRYNSLADFYYRSGKIEIRLPWNLLSVMDPSTKKIIANLYTHDLLTPTNVDNFYFGIANTNKNSETVTMEKYSWDEWKKPTYHERLKQSYYIVQKKFATIK